MGARIKTFSTPASNKLYDGVQLSWNAKLAEALKFLGMKWVLHPQYSGKHSYR